MEIQSQEYKRVAVVTISGRIDSATSAEFEAALQDAIAKGKRNLILDMSQVEFLSSSGLRVLVTTLKTLRKTGGDICIAQPSQRARDAIDIAGLDVLFKSFDDREAAIASF
ncbi:MAG: STAS domain-containing protein [Anaerolineales bacterium]|nr:STAS domain-containing protein [Anaerolineales bacterium]